MILVDSSVWIDHFRSPSRTLENLLSKRHVASHPFIFGELAMGHLKRRREFLTFLADIPSISLASDDEVFTLIETRGIYGRGISYIDAHLLASTRLDRNITLWTRDKRLLGVATEIGIATMM